MGNFSCHSTQSDRQGVYSTPVNSAYPGAYSPLTEPQCNAGLCPIPIHNKPTTSLATDSCIVYTVHSKPCYYQLTHSTVAAGADRLCLYFIPKTTTDQQC